jgi:hypothetical protein
VHSEIGGRLRGTGEMFSESSVEVVCLTCVVGSVLCFKYVDEVHLTASLDAVYLGDVKGLSNGWLTPT